MEKIINSNTQTIPETGRVGYVHIEDKHYDGTELKPRLFDVDSYTFEPIS